jgi:hypothetical protein
MIQAKLLEYGAIAALLCLAIWWYGHSRYVAGQAEVRAEDAKAVAAAIAKNIETEAQWNKQWKAAQDKFNDEEAQLATLRATPPRVVRIASGRCAVSAPTGDSAHPSTASGDSPQVPERDIDYGPALYDLADYLDERIAACRKINGTLH